MPDEKKPTKVASISMKTIGFTAKEIRKLVEAAGKEIVFLARVGGIAMEAFGGTSKHGEWTAFKGIFTLINRNGEAFTSSTVFLPANITKRLVEQLNSGVVEVQLLADISAVETEKNASGYAYQCEPVASSDAEKKMQTITDRVMSSKLPQIALPAPEVKKKAN